MRIIKTIPNDAKVDFVEYHPEFSVICSVGRAPFYGVIDISFVPGQNLLEFESFEQWLFSIANDSMTIEDLCRLTFDELVAALGDIPLCVVVNGRTTVHCAVSATIQSKGKA